MQTAHAIRHLQFENLGLLEPILAGHGYQCRYWDVGVDDLNALEQMSPDLLVILGGPISANDEATYPFLTEERRLVEQQLESGRPLLGICLGAQLVARTLGASIEPMASKEIGFAPLTLTDIGSDSVLSPLNQAEAVLHWHGESCRPDGRLTTLARTPGCDTQAFQHGPQVLGLQFHLEVPLHDFERWLIGHCHELASIGADVKAIRAEAQRYLPPLESLAREVFEQWLNQATPTGASSSY